MAPPNNSEAPKVYRTSKYPSPNYQHREGQRTMPVWEVDEDVVISGISGRFAESDSVEELKYNLMNGVDMVRCDDKRWPTGLYGLPEKSGKIKDLSIFDATFFGVNAKTVNCMDAGSRILLEVVYEAIVDAGISPHTLRGKNIGVYVGNTYAETEEALTQEVEKNSGYLLFGCSRSLFANRVSYTFDFKGPSFILDTACSSSLMAFNLALSAIRNNDCEAAVVAGINISLNPIAHSNFDKLGMLSKPGACKVFDADVSGYVKSEAVSAIYLQRASDAKRIYATVVHSKTNTDGYKPEGISYPNGAIQKQLLEEVYEEAGINPADLEYLEAHGTGTVVGDYEETNNVVDFFCKGRKGPLLIGSVKSNLGHAESASGMCSIAKMVIALEGGVIPGNLHYNKPNPRIPALTDGRLKVVSENTPYRGGLVGINNFGMGGVNAHVILKPNPAANAAPPAYKGEKLFNFSGRTEESVRKMLSFIEEHPNEHNVYALLAKPALSPISGHPYRGYTIFNGENPVKEIRQCESHQKPIWYVYPGMGSQWTGMGRDLMEIEIFRDTVHRVHGYLKPYNIDMLKLIMEGDETTYDEILNSFVVIACIQVALTNILKAVGIEPDGIVGHSVGELGCAYADGCFSEEEMIMSAYWRGYQVKTSTLPPGAMAAVGMSWEEVTQRCPKGVVPACHNSEDSVTISGEATVVNKFVKELKAEGKFAKEVNSSNFAFHCYYMQDIAPGLLKVLEKTIPNPKPRTPRWKSSSIPEPRWGIELAQTSSAAYFVNNLVSPVLFHAAVGHIPKDAIIIEIAPHTLLQSVLKRTVGPDATFYGLMKRNEPHSITYLLNTLGKMYINGMNPDVTNLFPAASFPVPRGTPMISPLVEWDHSQKWVVPKAEQWISRLPKSGTEIDISSPDSKDYYLIGHTIDGRVLYPATGYLVLAWKELARIKGKDYRNMPVVIEDVSLYRATILPSTGSTSLDVNVTPKEGRFEIVEGEVIVVSGRIFEPEDPELRFANVVRAPNKTLSEYLPLKTKDVYKALRLLSYEYGPTFQGILEADNEGTQGKLRWDGNWVSFLDTVLQFSFIGNATRNLRLPTKIDYLKINPAQHKMAVISSGEVAHVPVVMDSVINVCLSGGVELREMKVSIAPRRPLQQSPPTLEEHHFVPLIEKTCLRVRDGNEQLIRSYADLCVDYIIQKTKELANRASTIIPNKKLLADIVKRPTNFIDADRAVDTFLSQTTLNASLLKVLQEIFSAAKDDNIQLTDVVKEGTPELQNDSLLAALLGPRVIRTCLDLVQENTPSLKIKIVEANAVSGNLFPKLVEILLSQPLAQVECIATDINPGQISITELERLNVKSATWDYANAEAPPKVAGGAHLVFANRALGSNIENVNNCLRGLASAVQDGGFLLLLERTEDCMAAQFLDAIGDVLLPKVQREDLLKAFQAEDLELISEKGDGILSTVFLLRKVANASENVSVVTVEENKYENWLEKVKLQLNNVQSLNADARLWLLAHDTPTNGIIGMINCLRQEGGGDKIRCIYDPSLTSTKAELLKKDPVKGLKSIYSDILRKDLLTNVFRDGVWGTYRHLPLLNGEESSLIETDRAYVNIINRGDLSSLRWFDSPMKFSKNSETELGHIYYSALNFRDIMLATGKLAIDDIPGEFAMQDCVLGLEYSGRDDNGRRIMGVKMSQSLATTVTLKPGLVWPVPDDWTLEEAATVPVVYTTVYYAFFMRTKLQKGETVLIHAGSGGVGQAAIRVALSQGCEVFTTVSTQEKRDFLKKLFPQLKDRNIANSRDTSFEHHILRETGGKGVHVVLNSLAEDQMMASVRLLAVNGRFLEIGKVDFAKDTPLGMKIFFKNIAFHGVLFDVVLGEGGNEMHEIHRMLSEGIKSGVVKPMRSTVFGKDEVEAAFRYMASGKHIGKVLIKIREEESEKVIVPRPLRQKALPRTTFYGHKSYIVTGGLGGFGLELCDWLIQRGVQNLVLTSRTGISDGYQSRCIRFWKAMGAKVLIYKNDVSEKDGATKLINAAKTLGPVGGIFNLAMVLRDGFMENQTVENFVTVCKPKVTGTHRLDETSRKLCPVLDHFVVFSSVSCGRGNAGQSNYGFANSVMERICEQRKKDGLPGLAIQWGAIGDVGVILESMGGNDMVIGGTLPQRIVSCMTTMDRLLLQSHPVVSSYVLAEKQGVSMSQAGQTHNLIDIVANILGIKDASSVSPNLTLADLGMDSLMGVEIKHVLERNFSTVLSINDIRQLNMKILHEINSGEGESGSPSQALVKEKADEAVELKVERYDTKNLVAKECVVALNKVTNGTPLFILHPIEGVTIALKHLASKIQCPVYGIQCTANAPLDTLEGLAAYYRQQIQNELPDGPYRIGGYSFGATVAFEMALQMQREDPGNPDVMEHLVLLDGSHSFLGHFLDHYCTRFGYKEMGQSEADTLSLFVIHFMPIKYEEVKAELLKIPSFVGKLNHVANMLMKTGKFSNQEDITKAAEIHHKEIVMFHPYSYSGKFHGKVTLIRAAQNETLFNSLGHDYGLGEVCTRKVNVHAVDGDHDTFILGRYGDVTANEINKIFPQ